MGFVVGYAPCGLSPQTDGMPVILKKDRSFRSGPISKSQLLNFHLIDKTDPIPEGIEPCVPEVYGRRFTPIPIMHRKQMPALYRVHEFDDRVRSVVLQPWIQRDHRRVEAPAADLLDLPSEDLKRIGVLIVL